MGELFGPAVFQRLFIDAILRARDKLRTMQLLARVGTFVRPGQTVRAIVRDGSAFRIRAGDTEYRCRAVIFAAPTFLAPE
jgi:thioredoxin reductase